MFILYNGEFTCYNQHICYFDFGYCLSVHKSQGSEWANVLFYNEELYKNVNAGDYRKWLYTGVTRAKSSLAMVI